MWIHKPQAHRKLLGQKYPNLCENQSLAARLNFAQFPKVPFETENENCWENEIDNFKAGKEEKYEINMTKQQ